jgi:hypothetical protein
VNTVCVFRSNRPPNQDGKRPPVPEESGHFAIKAMLPSPFFYYIGIIFFFAYHSRIDSSMLNVYSLLL